jgi:5-carboxymethyl-2-hydroxymuconate isomerase
MHAGEMFWQIMLEHLEPLMAEYSVTLSYEMRELEEKVKFNNRNF